jgi:hypothetical protein
MIEIDKHSSYKLYWIDFSNSQKGNIQNTLNEWNLKVLDVGLELAKYLKDKTLDDVINNFSDYVTTLFDNHRNVDSKNDVSYVIITNIGFMLEPFLMIDTVRLLRTYSKHTGVVLLWDGLAHDNSLFFWQNNPEFQINFSDTKITKIEL